MSVQVDLADLQRVAEARGRTCFLITVGPEGLAHPTSAEIRWVDGQLVVGIGRRSTANVEANSAVTVLWPQRHDGDYSLIVDGVASLVGTDAVVSARSAILHVGR